MGNDLKKIGNQTIKLNSKPKIISTYSIVGPKEGQGPLGQYFHEVISDDTLGKDSFEKAESEMMYTAIKGAINSANLKEEDIDYSDDENTDAVDTSDVPEVTLGCKVVIRNIDKETKTYKYDMVNGMLPKAVEVFTGCKVGDVIEIMGKEWRIEDVIF